MSYIFNPLSRLGFQIDQSSTGGGVTTTGTAIANNFIAYNDTTGQVIKDSGYSPLSFATSAQGTKADTAFAWGNHALAGYLLSINSSQVISALGYTPENSANKGAANGYAGLDSSGLIPAIQLPSYVDDVLEYADFTGLPVTGVTGKIYVTLDTSKTYRWSGSTYIEISASPGSTDSVVEGSTNLYFTAERARNSISATQNLSYNNTTGLITGPDLTNYLVNSQALVVSNGTITTSAPILDLSQTWNAGAVTFTGLKFNVTDTASAAASLLADLQVGGASKFSVAKDGSINIAARYVIEPTYGLRSVGATSTVITAGTTGGGYVDLNGSAVLLNSITFSRANQNLKLEYDAAETLAQRRGTNAQTFRVYNTYTDASNYERGFLRWSSNVLEIGTEAAGTGTSRNISIGNTSNVVTICGKTFQYRNSTSITIGASITATTFTTNGDVTDFNSNVSLASSSLITWTGTSRHNNGTPDVILLRDAAGTLAQRNGTNAQIFNLYNTYTDAANYERGFLRWNANVLQLGSEALGTGTQRQLQFTLGTVSASTPLSITQTWNNAAVTFSGVQLDFTDTASNSGSRILDFRINGASKLAVLKNGALFGHYDGGGIYIGQYAFKFGRGGFIDNGTAFAQFTTPHITPSFQISSDMSINWTSAGSLGGTADLFLRRDATATLAQRDGTNAQTFRLYNTYTDASNYERGFLRWNTNVLEIGTEAAGTGAVREIRVPMTTSSKWSFFSATDRRLDITFNGQHFAFNNSVTAIYIGGAQGVVLGASNVGGDNGVGFGSAGSVTVGRDAAFTLTCSPRISDVLAKNVSLTAGPAWTSASTNIIGGHIVLTGGNGASASAGAANGGNIYLRGGTGYGTGKVGNVILDTLPTSASGLPTGSLWNNFGIIRVIDGTNDDGRIKVTNNVTLSAETSTVASTTTQQVAAFAATSFRSAKLIAQVYDTVTGEVQVSEILLAHNGSTATYTEYGVVYTGSAPLVDYSADISGGNVRLLATRTTANSTQYKVSETLILA